MSRTMSLEMAGLWFERRGVPGQAAVKGMASCFAAVSRLYGLSASRYQAEVRRKTQGVAR